MFDPNHDLRTAVVRLSERAHVTATLRQEEYERTVKSKPQSHWRNIDDRVGLLTVIVEVLLNDQKALAEQLMQQTQGYFAQPAIRSLSIEEMTEELARRGFSVAPSDA